MSDSKKGGDNTKKIEALQHAAREFDLLAGEEGAGQAGGETFIQSLQPFGTGSPGAPEKHEGVQHKAQIADPALVGMTRNLKFAEALIGEQKELDPNTRAFLEGQLGQSLANVKVYSGKHTDMAVRAMGAEAFAVEHHVFFRSGLYNPSTSEGIGLLAHEVAHTIQGSGGTSGDKEEEARGVQSRASQMAEQAGQPGYGDGLGDMDLAMDQAAGSMGDVPVQASSMAIPGEGKDEEEDVNPADTSRAPDEGKVFEILRDAIFQKLRDEIDLQYNIHGIDI